MRRKVYEVYSGYDLVVSGTVEEVAEHMGIKPGTVFANVHNMRKRKKSEGYRYEWYSFEEEEILD